MGIFDRAKDLSSSESARAERDGPMTQDEEQESAPIPREEPLPPEESEPMPPS